MQRSIHWYELIKPIFRFFFNCLGCSSNCEDHVPVHIFIQRFKIWFISYISMRNLFAVFNQLSPTCYLMCFRRQTVCRPYSSEINAKNKLFKTNKQQRTKTVLSTYSVAKKISPQKWVLLGFEHRPLRYRCRALTIELASQLRAGPFLFFIFIFFLEAFFLLLLSCVFNRDHFLCIYFWFRYMKFINSSLQISSGKFFVAFTIYNKAMFVKLSASFSIPFYANLLRFPFLLV